MWIPLTNISQIESIVEQSMLKPQLIFKHSTRCSISQMAKHRLEKAIDALAAKYDLYYIDILSYREVSNAVADFFKEHHESPQVLVIEQKECTQSLSHSAIHASELC